MHLAGLNEIKVPVLVSVRSHRYPERLYADLKPFNVHVVNPELQRKFPGSHYIPDGIDDACFRPFVVGFAGKPDGYKGFPLIEQACRELGVRFDPAVGNVRPELMPGYYENIDVLVCASEDEGFCAPVMEALARNRPVISTRVGAAWHANLPLTWVDRTVESVKGGILKHWASRNLDEFRWDRICGQFRELYRALYRALAA